MKWAVASFAILSVLLIGSGARADSCELTFENGSVGVWQGQCRNGLPYGEGELTHNGKTSKAVVGDRGDDWVRFRLDEDGGDAGKGLDGRRPQGNELQRQATGQDPRNSAAASALAGGQEESEPAGDSETGSPPSAGARDNRGFREYNAVGGGAESRDRGEPAEDENTVPPPASAARTPEPPAAGDAVMENPARAYPSAAPCKLEVAGELHDWLGPCTADGRAYGQGRATGPDGSTYTGSAENGRRHGYGTATAPDGGWFQGHFRNGLAHGWGTFRGSDGNYYKARFEYGEQVGERIPVEYASLDGDGPDSAGNAGDGTAESGRWNDPAGSVEDEGWDRGAATDGSGPAPAGDGSATDDPAYVAALEKLEGRGKAGSAAPDDGYAAAGRLERRDADRRMAAERAAEREAEQLRDGIAEEQSRKRAARSAEKRQQRQAVLDRKAQGAAARLNRDMEAERARQAGKEQRSRSEERRRKSKALLDRNLKIVRLQQQLNRNISYCNTNARSRINSASKDCGNRLVWCPKQKGCGRAEYDRCVSAARIAASRERNRCEARLRSAYRRSAAALLSQKY